MDKWLQGGRIDYQCFNILQNKIWQIVGVLKTSSNKRVFENNYNMLSGQGGYRGDLFNPE